MRFQKFQPALGSRPGTLAIPDHSPPPRLRVMEYDEERLEERELATPEELAPYVDTPQMTWIDICGLGDEDVIRRLGEVFGLHPLDLEAAVNVPQRAGSQVHASHQRIITRAPYWDDGHRLATPQLCCVLRRNVLLTFQDRYVGFLDPVRERIRQGIGPIRSAGPDYLAYALIDAMIDTYYPLLNELSEELEGLEDDIMEDPRQEHMQRVHELRRSLVVLRRIGGPQREALNALARDDSPFLSAGTQVYLRSSHDHMCQVVEALESARELATSLGEMYLSNVGHRTNEVMKVLTLVGSVFIPMTFIAGIYGMNFENMPELHMRYGYLLAVGAMAGVAFGMLGYFRWRGWLGGRRRSRS